MKKRLEQLFLMNKKFYYKVLDLQLILLELLPQLAVWLTHIRNYMMK